MRVHSSITLYFCLLPLKLAMQGSIVCLILGDLGRDYPWESRRCLPLTGSYSQSPMDGGIGWRRHSRQRHEHRMDIASPNKRRPRDARGVSRMLFPSFERCLQEKTLIFHSERPSLDHTATRYPIPWILLSLESSHGYGRMVSQLQLCSTIRSTNSQRQTP